MKTVASASIAAFAFLILPMVVYMILGGNIGNWVRCLLPSGGVGLMNSFTYAAMDTGFAYLGNAAIWLPYLMLGVAFREQPGIRQTARTFLTLVLLNVVFDMFGSGIDLAGHLGGLIGGFLLASVLAAPRVGRVSWWQRGLAAVALVGLVLIAGYGLMMKAV